MTSGFPDLDPQPVADLSRSPLRDRDFAFLFSGQAVSVFGDRLVMVAMPFAVLSIPGADLSSVGLVLGASALSLALFVLVGGVYADRFPRHLTMLSSDVVRGLAQAVSAVLLLTGHATVWHLVALQSVYGAAEAFFRPAVLGLVPQVVGRAQIQPANALLSLTSNAAMVLGPAVSGILVVWLGAGGALAVDAATFFVSGATLLALRPRPLTRGDDDKLGFLGDLRGGWREVHSRSWVWSVILGFSAYHAFVLPALFILGPLVAAESRGGAGAWGLISAGFGVGAVIGSVLALRWRPARPGIVVGVAICLSSTQAGIVVSPLPTLVIALLELGTGVSVAIGFTVWETALQERIAPIAQSRVSSFDYLGSLTLMPLGYLAVGPIAAATDVELTAWTATGVSFAVCVVVAASPGVRRLTRLPHERNTAPDHAG